MVQDRGQDQLPRETHKTTLFHLLSNSLILNHTTPYLPIRDTLNLAATSQDFRELVHHTPGVFRHLSLTSVKAAQFDISGIDHGGEIWRNAQLDENLTEDEYVNTPNPHNTKLAILSAN
jgi:hypothetical protein